MLQYKLSGLAILSIADEHAKQVDVDGLLNTFAEKMCGRKKLWTYCIRITTVQ